MNEDDQGFGLEQSFYIDNDELNDLSPQQCFVLGWEFCRIGYLLDSQEPFEQQFHSENEARVRRMLNDKGVTNFRIAVHDDWPLLIVAPSEVDHVEM